MQSDHKNKRYSTTSKKNSKRAETLRATMGQRRVSQWQCLGLLVLLLIYIFVVFQWAVGGVAADLGSDDVVVSSMLLWSVLFFYSAICLRSYRGILEIVPTFIWVALIFLIPYFAKSLENIEEAVEPILIVAVGFATFVVVTKAHGSAKVRWMIYLLSGFYIILILASAGMLGSDIKLTRMFTKLNSLIVFGIVVGVLGCMVRLEGGNRWDRPLSAASVVISVLLAFLSGSRSLLLFAAVFVGGFVLWSVWSRGVKSIVVLSLFIATATWTVLSYQEFFVNERILNISVGEDVRMEVWSFSAEKIGEADIEQKMFGHGFGSISFLVKSKELKTCHNSYLQVVYSFGVVGIVFYLGVFGNLLINGGAFARIFILAYMVYAIFNDSPFIPHYTSHFHSCLLFYMMLGLSYDRSLVFTKEESRARRKKHDRKRVKKPRFHSTRVEWS